MAQTPRGTTPSRQRLSTDALASLAVFLVQTPTKEAVTRGMLEDVMATLPDELPADMALTKHGVRNSTRTATSNLAEAKIIISRFRNADRRVGALVEATNGVARKVVALVTRGFLGPVTLLGASIRQCTLAFDLTAALEQELHLYRHFTIYHFDETHLKAPVAPAMPPPMPQQQQQQQQQQRPQLQGVGAALSANAAGGRLAALPDARCVALLQWLMRCPGPPTPTEFSDVFHRYAVPLDGQSTAAFMSRPFASLRELFDILGTTVFNDSKGHTRRAAAVLRHAGLDRGSPIGLFAFEGCEEARLLSSGAIYTTPWPVDNIFYNEAAGEVLLWDEQEKQAAAPARVQQAEAQPAIARAMTPRIHAPTSPPPTNGRAVPLRVTHNPLEAKLLHVVQWYVQQPYRPTNFDVSTVWDQRTLLPAEGYRSTAFACQPYASRLHLMELLEHALFGERCAATRRGVVVLQHRGLSTGSSIGLVALERDAVVRLNDGPYILYATSSARLLSIGLPYDMEGELLIWSPPAMAAAADAQEEARERARIQAEAAAQALLDAQAREQAAQEARLLALAQAQEQAAQARVAADAQARLHAEAQAREQARLRAEAEAQAKAEAWLREQAAQARAEAQAREQARIQAEAAARTLLDAQAREQAAQEARLLALAQAQEQAAQARATADEQARLQAEAQTREQARLRAEADAQERAEAWSREQAAQAQTEAQAREQARVQAESAAKERARAQAPPPPPPTVAPLVALPDARHLALVQWLLHLPSMPNRHQLASFWDNYQLPAGGQSTAAFAALPFASRDELCEVLSGVLLMGKAAATAVRRRGAVVLQHAGLHAGLPVGFVAVDGNLLRLTHAGGLSTVQTSFDHLFPFETVGEVFLWDELDLAAAAQAQPADAHATAEADAMVAAAQAQLRQEEEERQLQQQKEKEKAVAHAAVARLPPPAAAAPVDPLLAKYTAFVVLLLQQPSLPSQAHVTTTWKNYADGMDVDGASPAFTALPFASREELGAMLDYVLFVPQVGAAKRAAVVLLQPPPPPPHYRGAAAAAVPADDGDVFAFVGFPHTDVVRLHGNGWLLQATYPLDHLFARHAVGEVRVWDSHAAEAQRLKQQQQQQELQEQRQREAAAAKQQQQQQQLPPARPAIAAPAEDPHGAIHPNPMQPPQSEETAISYTAFDTLAMAVKLARAGNGRLPFVSAAPRPDRGERVPLQDVTELLAIVDVDAMPVVDQDEAATFVNDFQHSLRQGATAKLVLLFVPEAAVAKPVAVVVSPIDATLLLPPAQPVTHRYADDLRLPMVTPGTVLWCRVEQQQPLPAMDQSPAAAAAAAAAPPVRPHRNPEQLLPPPPTYAGHMPHEALPPPSADFDTIEATTSQYREGGMAACTVIALAAAERILRDAQLSPAVIDAAVRTGAAYQGSSQLVADDQIDAAVWARLSFGQHANAASMFDHLPPPDQALRSPPCAFVITKPPETVVLLWLPTGFLVGHPRSAAGPLWVYVDSHPRPDLGLRSAYALVFDAFSTMRTALLQRQPFQSLGFEDAWLYDMCEFIGIGLKRHYPTQ